MEMVAWKAWYSGGRVFCSTGVDPSELPDDGCLGVKVAFDKLDSQGKHYCREVKGSLYWYVEILGHPTWCSGDHEDKPAERYPGAIIVKGKWTSDDEMWRVNEEMAAWRG